MLRQTTVFGKVRDAHTGKVVNSEIQIPHPDERSKKVSVNGVTVELRSQNGRDWFMRPDSLLAVRRRVVKIAYLTEREKRWLDLVELPWSDIDVRSAVRSGFRCGGAE